MLLGAGPTSCRRTDSSQVLGEIPGPSNPAFGARSSQTTLGISLDLTTFCSILLRPAIQTRISDSGIFNCLDDYLK